MRRKRDWRFLAGCVISAAVFGMVVGMFLMGMDSFLARAGGGSPRLLRDGITRACVQCYAIEGRYPPSVQYLQEHYGVQIDEDRYYVFYDGLHPI